MGYCISSRFSTTEERDKMYDFLEKNYHLVAKIRENDQFNSSPMSKGEELTYAPKRLQDKLVGFGASMIDHSLWSICAWMSVKSSYRSTGKPCLYYDSEAIQITVNETIPKVFDLHFNVDIDGIVIERNIFFNLFSSFYRHVKHERLILSQLNEAWKES